jgi:hypothetical protein
VATRSTVPATPPARSRPLQLLSAQQQRADEILVVLQNPAGGAETAAQTVELRLAG